MKKRISRWAIGALLAPFILFFVLATLLYVPPVQDFAVRKTAAMLSESTGMDVRVERLRLTFLFDIDLQGVTVDDTAGDRLLQVGSLGVDLDFRSLLRGRINVDGIELQEASVDTKSLISGVSIRGDIGHFFASSHGIELPQGLVTITTATLADADIDIRLSDSAPDDTTASTPVAWRIAVPHVELARTRIGLSMPGDSMRVAAGIANADLRGGIVDLEQSLYTVRTFALQADSVSYDLPHEAPVEGFDPNHLALRDVALGVDSISFDGLSTALSLAVRDVRMREKSGLEIRSMAGQFSMDSTSVCLPNMVVRTPDSYVRAQAAMDFSAVAPQPRGSLSARVAGEIGKQDLLLFAGGLPPAFVKAYPNAPIVVRISADGNLDTLNLTTAEARLEGAFELQANGQMRLLTDSLRRSADANFRLQTYDLDFAKALAGSDGMETVALPPMDLTGKASVRGQRYAADLTLREGQGLVAAQAELDAARMSYEARVDIDNLQMHHFLPKDSLRGVSLTAHAKGRGTDIFSHRTQLQASAAIDSLQYGQLRVSDIGLTASLEKGQGRVAIDSHNSLLEMATRVEALLNRKRTDLSVDLDVRRLDLHALGVTAKPLTAGMNLKVDGSSNFEDAHTARGSLTGISLAVKDTTFHPKDLHLNLLATPDTTLADIAAGDFKLFVNGRDGYEKLMADAEKLMAATESQLKRRHLDQDSLKLFFPRLTVDLESGKENPVANYLASQGYSFREMRAQLSADPEKGLNGGGYVYGLNATGILLDTIQAHIFQDTTGVKMDAWVRNGKRNKQFVFDSKMNAYLHAKGAGVDLLYLDDKGKTGVDFGLRADAEENGLRVSFSNSHPVVAYRTFDINADNYIFLGNDRRVEANVDMVADDGTHARLFSTPNEDALQDLSVNLERVNLGELTAVIPYAPRITGFLQADAHLIQTEQDLSVAAEMRATGMAYEGAPLGDIGMEAVYLPQEDGTHYVDARLSHDDAEVMVLAGAYKTGEKESTLQADLDLSNFPLALANGFIPDKTAALEGLADGQMSVAGPTDKLVVDGWLATREFHIKSSEYSLNLRLEDDTIRVDRSRLDLDQLNVYSTGKNPLVFDGTVDFSDFENILLDLRAYASNFELINAKRTQQASAYGKVDVDVDARVRGNLSAINVTGRLGLLGTTDVTYVLKDSPLSSEDRLSGLVTFVDFGDTTAVAQKEQTQPMNLNMMMRVDIDQGTQVHCLLSADRSKYIDLEGGGELTMTYSPQGELTLTGRYTVLDGEMKYSLPVIPLKTFSITSGSYVDFNGPILNPTLNIAATERLRATVTENESPRTVAFNVGLSITRTLADMGLEFTIEAPEDLTVQNQLAAMSAEERGKVAVTMLATGMYIAGDGSGSGFSTTNALNALLQSEINNIAGKALETIDLSLGVDQETTAEGTSRTDYSFRFAKRFWGNRVSIIVGGKVSTGENVENTGQSLIDNISLEYRLDKSATRYVTIFYNRNYESLLEGEITEMGAGLVLRRKMSRLGELFIFKNKKKDKPQTGKEQE